jgi:hypothetical protein
MTRRNFLKLTMVPLSFGAASVFFFGTFGSWISAQIRRFGYRLNNPSLRRGGTGALSDSTTRTLLGAVEALVGGSVETVHYEIFFGWRAEHLRGTRDLYDKFVATLDKIGRKSHRRSFLECDLEARQQMLKKFTLSSQLSKFQRTIFFREDLLFYNHIIKEILKLYSRTDAWIDIGYENWPGQARGFEYYQRAVGP